jgi:uncharacterized protein (DUF302 family)
MTMPNDGLVSVQSRVPANETLKRLLAALATRKLTVFARIDHAAGAASVGLPLRPTEVVIFGNARGGTVLMQDRQSAGIDLPLKASSPKMPTARPGSPTTIRRGSPSDTASAPQVLRP